ncbi:MAG TPA: hypothetical protein VH419_09900 [Nocardioidaceae bacterium]
MTYLNHPGYSDNPRDEAPGSPAELLMLSGVVRECPDCAGEQIFVAADDVVEPGHEAGTGAYCCTACGAAILLDPLLERQRMQSGAAEHDVA